MAWSIFTQGGGKGSAVTYAQDLLQSLGVPQSTQNVQFVYDWEVSEGGGGAFNPLNVGPYEGLATTGQQYGGGAADYPSYSASIKAVTDLLNKSYPTIVTALKSSSYSGAEQALWASPWAGSHYGYGSMWSTETPPGATPINLGGNVPPSTTAPTQTQTTSLIPGISVSKLVESAINQILKMLGLGNLKDMAQRLGLIILGFVLVIVGIRILSSGSGKQAITVKTSSEKEEEGEAEPEGETKGKTKGEPKGETTGGSKRSSNKPVREEEKVVGKAAGSTGAEEAVEAAAIA
jgi:hypothetical protein